MLCGSLVGAYAYQKASPTVDKQRPQVTFNKNVAPIIFGHCGICHRPGGDAPFTLLTYAAVRRRATLIAAVTASGLMPPGTADSDFGEFDGLGKLSTTDIAAVQRWIDAGMPEGDEADLPELPHWPKGWQLGRPDLIVTTSQPYTLRAEGVDEYRTFVVHLPIDRRQNVRGIEFHPGVSGVVHHANILLDKTSRSRDLDERDPAPGYDGPLARTAMYPDGHFLGYAPGRPDPLLPKGMAWRVDPGTDLVLQLHLRPSGKPETIQPSVGFYLTDDPPGRTPFLMRLGRQALDIAPGDTNYRIRDTFVMPVDVHVLALKPHAHYLAREMSALAKFPDGTTKRLLYIRQWDFKWQTTYRFIAPVALPEGSSIVMEFTYDNSDANPRNPNHPPSRVRWGPATSDEMGDLWVQVLTRDDADRVVLARDFRPKAAAEEIAGYCSLLEHDPDDPILNDDIASLYLEVGQPGAAIVHFERSVRVNPQSASAQFNLGTALMLAGRTAEAVTPLQAAVRLKPDSAPARNNLGNALAAEARGDEALSQYQAALRLEPAYARPHNGMATLLMRRAQFDDALGHLRAAIAIDPSVPEFHYNLALTQQARAEYVEAVRHFRDAIRLRPEAPEILADCAWLLATAPVDLVRDPRAAVELSEAAAGYTQRRDPRVLGIVAAAYASAGRFDQAVATVAEALELSPSGELRAILRAHQALYLVGSPVRSRVVLPQFP